MLQRLSALAPTLQPARGACTRPQRRPGWQAGLLVVLASSFASLGLPAAASAAVPLTDSGRGMTCYFYAAIGRLEWLEPGGDWVDSGGKQRGERAYTTTGVGSSGSLQKVQLDLAALAREWNEGKQPGGVYLRAMGAKKGAIVNFRSREHPDRASWPVLRLEWDDGKRVELAPSADTYFACPTHKSLGASKVFKVGDGDTAALVFPFEARAGHKVVDASLTLTSDKQYGGGATIGVFRPDPPFSELPPKPGLAQAYTLDAGLEAHPDVLFVDRFEKADWDSEWSGSEENKTAKPVAADPGNRFKPLDGKALKVTVETGKRQGLNLHLRFARRPGGEPEEAYFRYYLRFGEDWNPLVTGGKLPGLSGTYDRAGWGGRVSDGTNGWSARGGFFQQIRSEPAFAAFRGIGSYIYHPNAKTEYGDPFGWNLGPTGMLEKNRWYSIEQYVKLNSPGKSDGVFRAWVDGKLAYEQTGMRYRDVPELKIESVWMNVYHGGIAKAKADLSLYIDNVVVARRYIGPAGGRQ